MHILTAGMKLNGRYLIEGELGRGGVGVVYRARDEWLVSRPVVVKVLLSESARNAWLVNKFSHELEALSRIDHPGIVGVLDKGELAGGQPFLVMQFVNGVSLRSVLGESAMSVARVANIIRQLGRALSAIHERNICHRDLKPENIMLQDQGEGEELVKIIDFGIAKVQNAVTGHSTSGSQLAGTPYYMAPEQFQHEAATSVSDIYALGVIIYEMLAGRHPFVDLKGREKVTYRELYRRQCAGPGVLPRQLRSELPEEADEIIKKALTPAPESRYQRARDLGEDLANALSSQNVTLAYSSPQFHRPKPRVALLYKRRAQPDEYVLRILEEYLKTDYEVFIDRRLSVGVEWAREIESQIRAAEAVVPLLSATSAQSEMLAHEVEIAHEAAQQSGKPRLLPVRVNHEASLPEPLHSILDPLQYAHWGGREDDQRLKEEITQALRSPPRPAPKLLEAEGGAVPLESKFYIVRPTDQEFLDAIKRRDSIVLVKGARQMGKTSLLARGLHVAREIGARTVLTDLQKFNAEHLASVEIFFKTLGSMIADYLDLSRYPEDVWDARHAPNINFQRYLRLEVLGRIDGHLVWGMDEVDRLFSCPFASDVFGLIRSWHNDRASSPGESWQKRLTMAMAYATEAHLFIINPNQSPFNVGTRLTLDDFTPEQVARLNQLYGEPLRDAGERQRFYELLRGHPYLVRRGLSEMASHGVPFDTLEQQASLDEGPFGDHLRRFLVILAQDDALCEVMRKLIRGQAVPSGEDFYRLRSAGLLSGDTAQAARPRCQLYADYFRRHLL